MRRPIDRDDGPALALARGLLAVAVALFALPAAAQGNGPEAGETIFDGDFLVVGAGGVFLPSYEGSDDLTFTPGAAVAGQVGGIRIAPRAAGAAFDLVPDAPDAKVGLIAGPVIRYRFNRTGGVEDEVVEALGELDGVFEAGPYMGLRIHGVLHAYDMLTIAGDLRFAISGKDAGTVFVPGFNYLTPLSQADVFGFGASVSIVDDDYAQYNFSVDAAGSAASGLPQYRAEGGFKDWSLLAYYGHDLDGDLRNGGFVLGSGLMFTRIRGSAADSPIVALRGSTSQWFFGAGLGYIF